MRHVNYFKPFYCTKLVQRLLISQLLEKGFVHSYTPCAKLNYVYVQYIHYARVCNVVHG